MKYATVLSAVWGVVLGLVMLVGYQSYLRVPNVCLLAAFIASAALSTVMNVKYGYLENVQGLIWLGISLIVIYVGTGTYRKEEILKEFRMLSVVYVAYCTLTHIVSLSMIGWFRDTLYRDPLGEEHLAGFLWGRLWGTYDEPNRGAVMAVIAIFFAVYLRSLSKKGWQKGLCVWSIVIQFLYIVLSDSRTGQLSLAAGLFVYVAAAMFQKRKGKKYHLAAALLTAAVVAVLSVGIISGTKMAYNAADEQIVKLIQIKHPEKKTENNTKIGRKADIKEDVSNGRIQIWTSGLELFQASPVYGVSFRNMTEFANDRFPDTYIVNNTVHIKYDSLHNMPVDVLVSQGVFGFVIFIFIIGNTIRYIRNKRKSLSEDVWEPVTILFVVLVCVGAASMVLSTIFYLNSPETFWFWLCFAYFMGLLKTGQKEVSE